MFSSGYLFFDFIMKEEDIKLRSHGTKLAKQNQLTSYLHESSQNYMMISPDAKGGDLASEGPQAGFD